MVALQLVADCQCHCDAQSLMNITINLMIAEGCALLLRFDGFSDILPMSQTSPLIKISGVFVFYVT